jgi:hypothetical protein
MASLLQVYDNKVTNSELRNRVVAAWGIFELETPTAAQVAWAKEALNNAESMARDWMWAVCGNAAVQAASFKPTDGDIQYIVNAIRDDVIAKG